MTQSVSHGTPAGKTLAEHRALRALLDEIGRASADTPAEADDVKPRLDILRERLAAHFESEEKGGLFEQILEQAPEQAHECEKLCAEHAGLLRRVDELRTADAPTRADPAWGQGVRSLLNALAHHEDRENEILTRALDGSVAAQD